MKGHGTRTVIAPFSPRQVNTLNEYQFFDRTHPFTCDKGHVLQATEEGWVCGQCEYTQNWAHEHIADCSWKNAFDLK